MKRQNDFDQSWSMQERMPKIQIHNVDLPLVTRSQHNKGYLSIHTYMYIHPSIYMVIYLSIHPSIHSYVHVNSSIYLFIHHPYIHLSIHHTCILIMQLQEVEEEVEELRIQLKKQMKNLEAEVLSKVDLQNQIQSLREDMAFKKKLYDEVQQRCILILLMLYMYTITPN